MPFLAAIPVLMSAAGVGGTAMATAATIASALAGATGLASGIIQNDPLGAATSAISGAVGGLGGMGSLGGLGGATGAAGAAGAGADAAGAAQGLTAATPILGAGETAANTVLPAIDAATTPVVSGASMLPEALGRSGMMMHPGADLISAAGNATKGMSTMDMIGQGLQGASAATQGVMGIIDAFRDKGGVGRMNFGAINSYLPAMQGSNLNQLPQAPQFEGGVTRTPFNIELDDNQTFYQLMNAFQG